jgi:hypothetical protein
MIWVWLGVGLMDSKNDLDTSIQVGKQSLDMYEKVLGSHHPKVVEMKSMNWYS